MSNIHPLANYVSSIREAIRLDIEGDPEAYAIVRDFHGQPVGPALSHLEAKFNWAHLDDCGGGVLRALLELHIEYHGCGAERQGGRMSDLNRRVAWKGQGDG